MAQGLIGQHVIGEVGGEGGHPAAGAGGTKATALVGEGYELIEEAGGAAQASETEGGVSAADECVQFVGAVGGQGLGVVGVLEAIEECVQVGAQDLLEGAGLGFCSTDAGRRMTRSLSGIERFARNRPSFSDQGGLYPP